MHRIPCLYRLTTPHPLAATSGGDNEVTDDTNIDKPVVQTTTPDPAPDKSGQNTSGQSDTASASREVQERIARAKRKEREAILKELGYEDLETAKAELTEVRQVKQGQMTELQKAQEALATAQKAAKEAEAKAAELEAARINDRIDAALTSAASALRAEHPQDVVDLLRKGDVSGLIDDKGEVDQTKVKALVDQAKKDRPGWFMNGGVGSPSNRSGVAPEPNAAEKQAAIRALQQNLRNKF